MLILRKLINLYYFRFALVLIMFSGQSTICRGQQLPDNIADTVLTWINQARNPKRLEILSIDSRLNKAAEKHSKIMVEHNMLSESNPDSETPFNSLQSSGITDTNTLVAVAQAKSLAHLQEQLGSAENLSKILSSEMTHTGVGIEQDSKGGLWLTIYMTERAITFNQFTLSQSNTDPVEHSITIKGNTAYKKARVILVPPENSVSDLEEEHIIAPDPNGDFKITLNFGTATGMFEFEFYIQKDGAYNLKNFFTIGI